MTLPDDADLLRATARGDRDAFAALVERHQAGVFRYLRAAADSQEDAEDALQETFVSVWRNAAGFRGTDSARGWLLTIARNALRKSMRRRVGEPASHESYEDLGARCGWGSDEGPLESLERRDLLERALDRLAPDDREILVLRELEGFEGKDVAHMMNISIPAMKSRLHRARLRFVASLRELADA